MTALPRVTPDHARRLARLGCRTVGELLWHLPRRHDDQRRRVRIAELQPGTAQTVEGTVTAIHPRPTRNRRLTLVEGEVADDTGRVGVVWFNQRHLLRVLQVGDPVLLHGPAERDRRGALQLRNPVVERGSGTGRHVGGLVAVYPETAGISSRWLRARIADALPVAPAVVDPLPSGVQAAEGVVPLAEALRQVHAPQSPEQLAAAWERLAFDDLFLLQLGALHARHRRQASRGVAIPFDADVARAFVAALPFQLTGDQRRAAWDVLRDMARSGPMNRLLQGDVGTGKTVVAAMALRMAVHAGFQGVLMAPTELLARQHFATLEQLLAPFEILPRLLVGSTGLRQRREILTGMAAGHDPVLVGTHALIEGDVAFNRLGLCVVDEQHRFGVAQRLRLREKAGHSPDFLAMTATPIPRSLHLTVYGDLDLSVIRERPPGRQPVGTRIVEPGERAQAYRLMHQAIREGRQGFVICPLVEDSETIAARSATVEYERLRTEVFPDLRLTLLHGRLPAPQKVERMAAFAAGEVDLLVATSIVEVGVDVPNATLMVIEGAERFGIAQLHQFRGRIGRGAHQSWCLLFTDDPDATQRARLQALVTHDSGFELAEIDLRLRGPGDPYGLRQHGLPEVRVGDLLDLPMQTRARAAAERALAADPELRDPALRRALTAYRTVFEFD